MNNFSISVEQVNSYEQYFIRISQKYVAIIKNLLGKDAKYYPFKQYIDDEKEFIKIKAGNLNDIIKNALNSSIIHMRKEAKEKIAGEYLEEYRDAYDKFSTLYDMEGHKNNQYYLYEYLEDFMDTAIFVEGNSNKLEELFSAMNDLDQVSKKIYKLCDLKAAKNSVMNSLKYICDEEQVNQYNEYYNQMLSERPVDLKRLELFLRELQVIILEDWKNQIDEPSAYQPGEPFKLICHSMAIPKYEGDFYGRYVSCSLLTEEFTETYKCGFGFVLSPDNIVCANGEDLYTYNSSTDEEDMLMFSSIPVVTGLDETLNMCRKRRLKNQESEETKNYRVYNEVVIDGFNPIAIFCITNQENVTYDNYEAALNLQKAFPNLKIINIDLELYKNNIRH